MVPAMGILQLLDDLPTAVTRPPAQLWSVLARSLGEQGATGRTALAWRWALTGACPSPVTLATPATGPPGCREIIDEAKADAELGEQGIDLGGQVMQARFVLEWLTGKIDALPLWNGGPKNLEVSDGAPHERSRAEVEEVYFWALLAQDRYPWCDVSAPDADRMASGWACGALDLLTWVCGEASEGPLSGQQVTGRPVLYQLSLEASRGMSGVESARRQGNPLRAGRLESAMEAFLWLTGWNSTPPVDRHGHGTFDACPERNLPCLCNGAGRCLRDACAACCRAPCVPAAQPTKAR
jgi:hypothetical protein